MASLQQGRLAEALAMPLSAASHAGAALADACLQLVQEHAESPQALADGNVEMEGLQNLLESAEERFSSALPPLRGSGRPAENVQLPEAQVASAFAVAAAYARLLSACNALTGPTQSVKSKRHLELVGKELLECKGVRLFDFVTSTTVLA
jgi:hypothetical protein